jgi:hypothetical protein
VIPVKVHASTAAFLRETQTTDISALFCLYAQHLLRSSDALLLPVPLERIRERHGLRRHSAPLDQRGFLLGDAIVINSDDPETVQRFTEAHEFMEVLYAALRAERPSRFSNARWRRIESEKERWCERGAAELLMPASLVFPTVAESGVGLAAGRTLARLCGTSLTASVRRMLEMEGASHLFVLLKEGYKKSQQVPSAVGQGVLWGAPEEWDPPAELRVWRYWSSPQVKRSLCWNESVSRDSLIYRTFQARMIGEIIQGEDRLDFEHLKGVHVVECMVVRIDRTFTVMALIRLEPEHEK